MEIGEGNSVTPDKLQNPLKPDDSRLKSEKTQKPEGASPDSLKDTKELTSIKRWFNDFKKINPPHNFEKPEKDNYPSQKPHSVIKNLFYPSTNQTERLAVITLPITIAGGIATALASPEIAPFIYVAGVLVPLIPIVTEAVFQRRNIIQINDLMIVLKAVSGKSKELSTGEKVKSDDLVGELHIEGANVRKKWRKLSPDNRGRALIEAALDGFIKLGSRCQTNDPRLAGIEIFKGKSDLIKPGLFKRFGFAEIEDINQQSGLLKFFIRVKRISALGIVEGLKSPVGDIRTIWITRNNLIKALPQLTELHHLYAQKIASNTA